MPKPKTGPQRLKLLSHSRPPLANAATSSTTQSSRATRGTIRNYHTVQKRLAHALANGDDALAESLQSQLSASGGLQAYQAASTIGQSAQRGGDTSKVLVEWLSPSALTSERSAESDHHHDSETAKQRPLRILEVGALSTTNAINVPGETVVRRIDLRSTAPGIEQQDFMTLPIDGAPWRGSERYDVLSLSLVVNFVGNPRERGRMLERTTEFLQSGQEEGSQQRRQKKLLPALFLVLPLPCVDNSRYLNEERLTAILQSLGYEELHVKRSSKLYYSLWRYDANRHHVQQQRKVVFKKEELRSGRDRNNFCITTG
ncbi:uncharacterized protein HMPREF1541_04987 [Cyphellophora europaea CBS 101466]|uniref:25S rRNA adenine-N(1) methyltransferase n=1 Tax=Cyphellophora europaea (strain CBS 101466) TaxID=1220924 RepID=W2RY39_CYPE1|nr:uncharacterized protein HMPREF1541_04987 [Cyphellophora europaea CBS 101466]ETN40708.1 hypothetical protein HMPREF1541_04987 [Cyphellophora europaea CBS 101466]